VTLPVTEAAAPEEPTPVRDIIGYEGPRRVVLVAGDRQYNRLLLVDILEPLGFEVSTASDGQEAVDRALELQPEAIVMDLVMPVKTGLEAIQEIRGRPELEDVLIIAASASVLETDREKSLAAGCDAFLPKPIKTEDLLDVLAAHLGLSWTYAEPKVGAEEMASPLVPLAALLKLAKSGRIVDIEKHAARPAKTDEAYIPFSEKVRKLARRFEIEQIKAFVEQFIKEPPMARGVYPKGHTMGGVPPLSAPRHTHQMIPEGIIGGIE
jgi:CheY-like chemotaxis protein